MEKRQLATVRDVMYGKEDHGILTCYVTLDYQGGGTQGFGGLCLNEKSGPDFVKSVCNLFGVSDLKHCIGKHCYALFCFGTWNETIEGIENVFGNRFTLTSFSKRYDKTVKSRLERTQEDLKADIARMQERIKKNRETLKSLKKTYTDWDKK